MRTRLVALALFVLSLAACGCGASAVQSSAHALEISARVVALAGESISVAAEADARSACPAAEDPCLATISERWAPVDDAFNATHATLGAWYSATVLGREGFTLGTGLAFARSFALAYAALATALAPHGVSLPALPSGVLP